MGKIELLKKWVEDRSEQIIDWDGLQEKIESGKQILIKYGADPSKPDLHLGHGVCLRMMRKFQDELDAKVQFLIGDFTGQIGDPSGKSKAREVLDENRVKENALSYAQQVFQILDRKKTEVWSNGSRLDFVDSCQGGWWNQMSLSEFLSLLTMVTHAKLIDRDMFQERIKNSQEIYMHEMMYPILQGYDSVMMNSDMTIVGNDQLFNELMGRFFQEKFKQKPQTIITVPLLVGLDGAQKMSKSLGNYIGLSDTAEDMFGKTMSIPDSLIVDWARLATDLDYQEMQKLLDSDENPRDIKMMVAVDIVRQYYGREKALAAKDNFVNIFAKKNNPDEMREIKIENERVGLVDWLWENSLVDSKAAARRLIEQGGVKIDNIKQLPNTHEIELKDKMVIRVGKRIFVKLVK